MRARHAGSAVNHGHMKRSKKSRLRTMSMKIARAVKSFNWKFHASVTREQDRFRDGV